MTHPAIRPGQGGKPTRHHKPKPGAGEAGTRLNFSLINTIASKILAFAKGPLLTFLKVNYAGFWLVYRLGHEIGETILRAVIKLINVYVAREHRWAQRQLTRLQGLIWRLYYQLVKLIKYAERLAFDYTRRQVSTERRARQQAIARTAAEADRDVRALHQLIEREAASGYRTGYSSQIGVITRLAGYLADYDPLLRRIVGDVIQGVLDLATVEDPLARAALAFLLREVIDRLGVNQLAGDFLRSLLAPLLGQARPHDLNGVIAAISQRLATGEAQWAQFYKDGGSQVEAAGLGWQEAVSPLIDAALLAWAAQAVLDPKAWAAELSGTIGRAANDTAAGIAALIRKA